MRWTAEQEASYALDYRLSRDDLRPEVRAEYDRLLAERIAAAAKQGVHIAATGRVIPPRSKPVVISSVRNGGTYESLTPDTK